MINDMLEGWYGDTKSSFQSLEVQLVEELTGYQDENLRIKLEDYINEKHKSRTGQVWTCVMN